MKHALAVLLTGTIVVAAGSVSTIAATACESGTSIRLQSSHVAMLSEPYAVASRKAARDGQ